MKTLSNTIDKSSYSILPNIAFVLLFLSCLMGYKPLNAQQDLEILWLQSWTFPQTGCAIGGPNDQIRLAVKNNSASNTTFGHQIYLNYSIDGGPIITDSIPTLGAGAVWSFDFVNNQEDFSACGGAFNIVTWVTFNNDPDTSNDTLAYQFINYCNSEAGLLVNDSTYTSVLALDTIYLTGSQNVNSIYWEYSLNGLNWNVINQNSYYLPISFVDTLRWYRAVTESLYGCSDTSNSVQIIYSDSTLGLENQYLSKKINLFPNPFKDQLEIISEDVFQVKILDPTGKVYYDEKIIKGSNRLYLSNLPSGMYFIRLFSDEFTKTFKVLKQD